ncbi:hypothetical protein RN001_011434 [Aquatica leii]|uniref:Uncharacterized protein n=1 Tax=Aquatica leii TaxID=1421715 RepID=A0AAN7SCU2_9COLE|nr:hypothetical protein RN001_011434 [Aquatica leii]
MLLIISLNFILFIGLSESNNVSNENSLNDVLNSIRQITNGCNHTAYNNSMIALDDFQSFLDTTVNQTDASEGKMILNQFFQDLCYKKHKYMKHVSKVIATLLACAGTNEKNLVETGVDVFEKAVEYVCYKNGKRIALFFWRDGYECLMNNTEAIRQCDANVFDAKSLINCEKYLKLQKCVENAIRNCDVLTPINMIYAFMKHLYLQLSCQEIAL